MENDEELPAVMEADPADVSLRTGVCGRAGVVSCPVNNGKARHDECERSGKA